MRMFLLVWICLSGISLAQDSIKFTEKGSNGADKVLAVVNDSTPDGKAFISRSFSEASKIEKGSRCNVGPDASYVRIEIKFENERVVMESWHPVFESNGKAVATEHGIEGLNGRKLNEVIEQQSVKYQHFRKVFDSICAGALKVSARE